jgi:CRISPR-associated protein, csm2 family
MNLELINIKELKPDIFSEIAENTAKYIYPQQKRNKQGQPQFDKKGEPVYENHNKSSQIRKFYDELLMWDEKIHRATDKNAEYHNAAPFIHMIKAKAAYAKGRDHVDEHFLQFINKLLEQIESPRTLRNAKLFFEAVLGFRKAQEDKKADTE